MTESRRWTLTQTGPLPTLDCVSGGILAPGESVVLMPVTEHQFVRAAAQGVLETLDATNGALTAGMVISIAGVLRFALTQGANSPACRGLGDE